MRHPNRAQLTKTSKMSERKIETLQKDLHIPKKQLSTGFIAGNESNPGTLPNGLWMIIPQSYGNRRYLSPAQVPAQQHYS